MIPAAPARSAGLVRSDPGPLANWTNPLTWPLFPLQHTCAETRLRTLPQPVLAGKLRGLPSQLHPATRVGRDLGTRLGDCSPGTEDSSEPGQSQILRRQPLTDEEASDSRRIPDDRQAIAVTDQLNLVIHRPLLKRGQGEPRAPSPVKDGRGVCFSTVFFIA